MISFQISSRAAGEFRGLFEEALPKIGIINWERIPQG
jgi:hypothetical protein